MTTQITLDKLRDAIDNGTVTVVDALPAAPYSTRHLPGALNLTSEEAEAKAAELLPDKAATIVTYSTDSACTRGPELAELLERMGYTDVRNYSDGIAAWVQAGLPVEQG